MAWKAQCPKQGRGGVISDSSVLAKVVNLDSKGKDFFFLLRLTYRMGTWPARVYRPPYVSPENSFRCLARAKQGSSLRHATLALVSPFILNGYVYT